MPFGYAIQVHVVSVGDSFTVYDANHVAVASLEVTKIPVNRKIPFKIILSFRVYLNNNNTMINLCYFFNSV